MNHFLTKDSSLLHYAIHSHFYWRILLPQEWILAIKQGRSETSGILNKAVILVIFKIQSNQSWQPQYVQRGHSWWAPLSHKHRRRSDGRRQWPRWHFLPRPAAWTQCRGIRTPATRDCRGIAHGRARWNWRQRARCPVSASFSTHYCTQPSPDNLKCVDS